MTEAQLIALLQKRVDRDGLRASASDMGLSAPYLLDVIRGRREPGPKILAALGWEKVVTYRRLRGR